MIRLHFVVEGQTEEALVNRVLAQHLGDFDISCDARCVETSRATRRGRPIQRFKGGGRTYQHYRRDIERWTKEDQGADARFTTMVDLYHLPPDFPGYDEAAKVQDHRCRIVCLERAWERDVADPRFRAHIQLHEYEAMILCCPQTLARLYTPAESGNGKGIERLVKMVAEFESPEDIDDGDTTAPSKRIIREIPAYEGRKVADGPTLAEMIGLDTVRRKCPHFDAWLRELESYLFAE